MSVTFSSSVDVGYTNSSNSGGSVESVDYAYALDTAFGSGGGGGGGGVAVQFAGDATAVGTDTYAQMTVDAMVADNGSSSLVALSADLVAAAAAQDFDPFAVTTIWFSVIGPVDSYVQIVESESFTQSGRDGTVTVQSTSVDYYGVVLDDAMDTAEQSEPELMPYLDGAAPLETSPDCGCGDDPGTVTIDGNVVVFALHADAFGDDSYASITFDALAIEDTLSTLTGLVEVAIG